VDRLVAEAERHREGDRRLRLLIDARNDLESLAYLVERGLDELEEDTPVRDKAQAEMLLAEARRAIEQQSPPERVAALRDELREMAGQLVARGSPAPAGDRGETDTGVGS
jgi:molecular chaperone DnaK